MDIPKSFRPDKLKGINFKNFKKKREYNHSIEDLIIDETYFGCKEKRFQDDFWPVKSLEWRGINYKAIEKIIHIEYLKGYITLVQYKTKSNLIANLRSVFEKGTMCYKDNKFEFTEIYLIKDKIAIYIEGGEGTFLKEARDYYRKLGFKQLDYKLIRV